MSNNIHGIFASTINGNVNTGVNAVRGWDDAKCRRVYRACVAVLPAEEVAFVRESFANRYDYSQSQLESYMSSHRITAGQAWCCRMLSSVQGEHTTRHIIHGADEDQTIHDLRTADKVLRAVKAA